MMNPKDVIAELDAKHGIFINGRGLGTASTFDVRDPATCAVIAEISDGTASEATSAVEAAARAFPEWAATAPRVRAEILRRAFDLILRREIFGPVAPIVLWDNEDELLDWINDTEYGLAAYVYSGRLQDALRIGESIDAGMVGINRGIVSDPSAPSAGRSKAGSGAKAAGTGCVSSRRPSTSAWTSYDQAGAVAAAGALNS
jgi:acyl-CoA reductase-like NAD-dependent aldehyde dehydrogenase